MPPPERFGRYEVVRELGRGGMAVVYLARDPRVGREVAIKVISADLAGNAEFRRRFDREAQALARLEHSAIVPLYDHGEEDGTPYLVFRYMEGGSLAQRIGKQGALPLEDVAAIARRVGAALDYAHAQGVIHRDIKPANILFDRNGEAWLGDFGISLAAERTSALTSAAWIGSPAYMSPEQANGDPATAASDIYSLGCTLFEAVTGRPPFAAEKPVALLLKHLQEPAPKASSVSRNVPDEVDRALLRAMAKDPAQRVERAGLIVELLTTDDRRPPPITATTTNVGPRTHPGAATTRVDYVAANRVHDSVADLARSLRGEGGEISVRATGDTYQLSLWAGARRESHLISRPTVRRDWLVAVEGVRSDHGHGAGAVATLLRQEAQAFIGEVFSIVRILDGAAYMPQRVPDISAFKGRESSYVDAVSIALRLSDGSRARFQKTIMVLALIMLSTLIGWIAISGVLLSLELSGSHVSVIFHITLGTIAIGILGFMGRNVREAAQEWRLANNTTSAYKNFLKKAKNSGYESPVQAWLLWRNARFQTEVYRFVTQGSSADAIPAYGTKR